MFSLLKRIFFHSVLLAVASSSLETMAFWRLSQKLAAGVYSLAYWGIAAGPSLWHSANKTQLFIDQKKKFTRNRLSKEQVAWICAKAEEEGFFLSDSLRYISTWNNRDLGHVRSSGNIMFFHPFDIFLAMKMQKKEEEKKIKVEFLRAYRRTQEFHSQQAIAVQASLPFAFHAAFKKTLVSVRALMRTPRVVTLFRLPTAVVISGISDLAYHAYERLLSRRADAALKKSPELVQTLLSMLELEEWREDTIQRLQAEEIVRLFFERLHEKYTFATDSSECASLFTCIQDRTQEPISSCMQALLRMRKDEPRPRVRIRYLSKWLQEAEIERRQYSVGDK